MNTNLTLGDLFGYAIYSFSAEEFFDLTELQRYEALDALEYEVDFSLPMTCPNYLEAQTDIIDLFIDSLNCEGCPMKHISKLIILDRAYKLPIERICESSEQ